LECPNAETGNCLDVVNTDRHVPESLGDALNALEADTELCEAIGSELVNHFLHLKRTEWQKFMAYVTDWEINHYLPFH
jgi:glutamine synthetase